MTKVLEPGLKSPEHAFCALVLLDLTSDDGTIALFFKPADDVLPFPTGHLRLC